MRKEVAYRSHKIIASDHTGRPLAVVMIGKAEATPERFACDTLDEAVTAAKAWVDQKMANAKRGRPDGHIATVERYREFLETRPMKPYERAMLLAHVEHKVLTACQLAEAAGWGSYHAANSFYGIFGQAAADFLELTLLKGDKGKNVCTTSLAEGAGEESDMENPQYQWKIHRELAEAVVAMGLIERPA